MKGKKSVASMVFMFVLLVLTASLGSAQGPGPEQHDENVARPAVRAPMAAVPRTIPIQGDRKSVV